MTLHVRPASEKPEENRDAIFLLDGSETQAGHYCKEHPYLPDHREILLTNVGTVDWSQVTSWCYESDLIQYMKSAIEGGAGA